MVERVLRRFGFILSLGLICGLCLFCSLRVFGSAGIFGSLFFDFAIFFSGFLLGVMLRILAPKDSSVDPVTSQRQDYIYAGCLGDSRYHNLNRLFLFPVLCVLEFNGDALAPLPAVAASRESAR